MSVKQLSLVQLGRRIRTARLKLGLSQDDVAEPEYTAAYISHVEHGKRRPSHEALSHIASRLEMTLEQLLSGRDPEDDLRLEVETQRAIGLIHSGQAEPALATLTDVRDVAAKVGHSRALEIAETAIGLALYRLGRVDEALGAYERALELTQEVPIERRTTALAGKARCLLHSGEARKAVHILEAHLLELQRTESPDPGCLVETYAALIPGYFETGMISSAIDAATAGWELAPGIPDVERRACLYVNRAQLMLTQGEPREALTSLALAEDLYRHIGWSAEVVKVALAKSFVLTEQREFKEAEALIRDALDADRAAVPAVDRILALTRLALIRRKRGSPQEGLELANKALKVARSSFEAARAEARREVGLCERELGNPDAALDHWRKAFRVFVKAGDHQEAARTSRLIGDLLMEAGDVEGAAAAFRQGLGSVAELR